MFIYDSIGLSSIDGISNEREFVVYSGSPSVNLGRRIVDPREWQTGIHQNLSTNTTEMNQNERDAVIDEIRKCWSYSLES